LGLASTRLLWLLATAEVRHPRRTLDAVTSDQVILATVRTRHPP
jgi:hypothetical protein